MSDQHVMVSIGFALYRYAYFMTQSQGLSKSMVFLVQDRARMMLPHTWHQMPLVWLVKMLREYFLHLQIDEGMNAVRGGGVISRRMI
jgi:hypothetical protein